MYAHIAHKETLSQWHACCQKRRRPSRMDLPMLKSLRMIGIALLFSASPALVACSSEEPTQDVSHATARQASFEIFEGKDGRHYFRLVAGNGENVLRSQGYASRAGAEGGIASVKVNGVNADRYRVREAADGSHYFNLVARNGATIGTSETYVSKSNAQRGAETVQRLVEAMAHPEVTVDVETAITKAAEGTYYVSEADYSWTYVGAELEDPNAAITVDLVKEKFASYIDEDPDTDKPLADLYSMTRRFEPTVLEACEAETDDYYREVCFEQYELDEALLANLTDIEVFYFGRVGGEFDGIPYVDGTAVSILIVGRTPDGNLAGVRTIAIWT